MSTPHPRRSRAAAIGLAAIALGSTAIAGGWALLRERGGAADVPAEPPASAASSAGPAPADADAGAGPTASALHGEAAKLPPKADPALLDAAPAGTLAEQREVLLRRMASELALSPSSLGDVQRIFAASRLLGQGNPEPTRHPMTRAECRAVRAAANLTDGGDPACGAPFMARVYDPATAGGRDAARVCIDQFEFPGIPCEYPVVYARASEAAALCRAIGKRICDAHEWEGACAGALRAPELDYTFGKARPYATWDHNRKREVVWAYGARKDHGRCGTRGGKSQGCTSGSYRKCGSNTYPAGAFPGCVSPLGVYDQHGNAAEHMNLPTTPEELASRGGSGHTEMKGSWFVFGELEAHEDDCRWRAKDWHPSRVDDAESHRNYHLGFRCCRDVEPGGAPPP